MCILIFNTFDSRFFVLLFDFYEAMILTLSLFFSAALRCAWFLLILSKKNRTWFLGMSTHTYSLSAKLYPHSGSLKILVSWLVWWFEFFPYSVSLLLPLRDRIQHVTPWRMNGFSRSVYNEGVVLKFHLLRCRIPPPPSSTRFSLTLITSSIFPQLDKRDGFRALNLEAPPNCATHGRARCSEASWQIRVLFLESGRHSYSKKSFMIIIINHTTLPLKFAAGAMLSFGNLLSSIVSGGATSLNESNPGLVKLLGGAVFPVGLIM